jgi:hypothetical protein
VVRGFLKLRAMNGDILAYGDLAQVPHGTRVSNRLVLRFKDGSLHDETVDFSQQRVFKVLNYHLVQSGPAFDVPIDYAHQRIDGGGPDPLHRQAG